MSKEIIHTMPGDANFYWFDDLPKQIYSKEIIQLRGSDTLNLEFLKTCLVLLDHGIAKARLALYKNSNLTYHNQKAMSIGNYESVDDLELSKFLLDFAFSEAKLYGVQFIIGPMNGSTWDNYRFSQHHLAPNFLLEPYHYLYYNQQFIHAGFSTIASYTSSFDSKIFYDIDAVLKREKELKALGLQIRSIDLNHIEDELSNLYPFILEAFSNNFLYTPIAFETFKNKYLEALKLMDSKYVLIAEDSTNQIIGFLFAYKDLFDTSSKTLVVKTVARNSQKQWAGLGLVLGNHLVRIAAKNGFTQLIHAFMINEATSSQLSKTFSGNIYKNYVLYGKAI